MITFTLVIEDRLSEEEAQTLLSTLEDLLWSDNHEVYSAEVDIELEDN